MQTTHYQHPEAQQLNHHITGLIANNKTIATIEFRGAKIKHKAQGGYQVGEEYFADLHKAKSFIVAEIKESFDALFNIMGITCTRFPNCLLYNATETTRDAAVKETNSLIYQMRLPLLAEGSTFNKETFTVKYNCNG